MLRATEKISLNFIDGGIEGPKSEVCDLKLGFKSGIIISRESFKPSKGILRRHTKYAIGNS